MKGAGTRIRVLAPLATKGTSPPRGEGPVPETLVGDERVGGLFRAERGAGLPWIDWRVRLRCQCQKRISERPNGR